MSAEANAPAARSGAGLTIAALILGIVAIALCFFIPIIGLIAGIIAVVLGAVALRRHVGRRGFAMTGVILGAVGIVGAIVNWIIAAVIISQHVS